MELAKAEKIGKLWEEVSMLKDDNEMHQRFIDKKVQEITETRQEMVKNNSRIAEIIKEIEAI